MGAINMSDERSAGFWHPKVAGVTVVRYSANGNK